MDAITTFDFVLENQDATLDNAIDAAHGLDWTEIETSEFTPSYHCKYCESINGVGIWYDRAADYYFFEDESRELEKPWEKIHPALLSSSKKNFIPHRNRQQQRRVEGKK